MQSINLILIYFSIVNPMPRIRSAALQIFSIQNRDLHASITMNLRNNLDITNKPANRYHGNSLQHRFLLRTLQCLLFSFKVQQDGDHLNGNVQWCIQRLVSQPHHVSSRIMLEWYISLYIIQNVSNILIIYLFLFNYKSRRE